MKVMFNYTKINDVSVVNMSSILGGLTRLTCGASEIGGLHVFKPKRMCSQLFLQEINLPRNLLHLYGLQNVICIVLK